MILRLAIASCAFAVTACTATAQAVRPNLVFILADDLGWSDTTFDRPNAFYETPNIQRLAQRGMRFTQAYAANPLCSPTRASILSGLYPARIGITAPVCHLPQVILEKATVKTTAPTAKVLVAQSITRFETKYFTLAEALKAEGYATGHFGKWHLGAEPYSPLQQGFDVDYPHWPGPGPAGSYVAPWRFPEALNFPSQPGEHIEDRMASEAIAFIKANRERPFYVNYWASEGAQRPHHRFPPGDRSRRPRAQSQLRSESQGVRRPERQSEENEIPALTRPRWSA
jgi:arylsulfatase A-like enzyme